MYSLGKLSVGGNQFCVCGCHRAELPFKVLYEEVPCQRRKVLVNYEYRILSSCRHAGGLRLRLEIGGFFAVDLEFRELADGFAVSLEPETLVEYSSNTFRVLELDIMPGFLSAATGGEGYFLLPNFCGSLVHFTGEKNGELRDMIYGDQCENEHYVTMPVCGMKQGGSGWLCIFTDGRYDARIITNANTDTYSLSPSFIIRHHKSDAVISDRREVQYICLEGDASYNAMARRYRRYLLEERGWRPLAERMAENPVLAYTARSYHCKIFMGMKFGRTYDGVDELTVTTTFDEAARIAEGMKADGIDRCTFFLVGWNPGGHDGCWPSRFPFEEQIGGLEGFLRLKQKLAESGYQLSVHDNHVDSYRNSEYFAGLDHLTDRGGEIVGGSQWGGGATYRICMKTAPSVKSIQDMRRMKELGVDGIYYLDNMPSPIFTCHDSRHPCSRRDYAMGVRRLAQSAADVFGCVSAESYQDYALDNLDMPWKVHAPLPELTTYFERVPLIDRLVPFFQVAYHGFRLYHTEYGYAYPRHLRGPELELALGSMPMNEVQEHAAWYIPSWRSCRELMSKHNQLINGLHADRQTVFIDSIVLADGRITTAYADGIVFEFDLNQTSEEA